LISLLNELISTNKISKKISNRIHILILRPLPLKKTTNGNGCST